MEDNEYGSGPEPKEQSEQPEEQGECADSGSGGGGDGDGGDHNDNTNMPFSSQLARRRKTGEMTEAGGRKVLEASEAVEVGAAREDEE